MMYTNLVLMYYKCELVGFLSILQNRNLYFMYIIYCGNIKRLR